MAGPKLLEITISWQPSFPQSLREFQEGLSTEHNLRGAQPEFLGSFLSNQHFK